MESQGLYSNPINFYDFLQNRVMISFRPKFEDISQDNPEFNLVLSKKQNYDTVCLIPNNDNTLNNVVRCPSRQENSYDMTPLSCDSQLHMLRMARQNPF